MPKPLEFPAVTVRHPNGKFKKNKICHVDDLPTHPDDGVPMQAIEQQELVHVVLREHKATSLSDLDLKTGDKR